MTGTPKLRAARAARTRTNAEEPVTATSLRRLIALAAAALAVAVLVGAPSVGAAPGTELVSLALTNANGDDLLDAPFDPTVYDLSSHPDTNDVVYLDVTGPSNACITVTSPSSGPAVGCVVEGVPNQLTRPGPWTITVDVAGQTSTVYTLSEGAPAPPSTNADLADIAVTPGTLAPAFQAPTTSYSVAVGYLQNAVTVTPTTADTNATMRVNGAATLSAHGVNVPLSLGANTVTILVRAEDGTTTTTTTVTITRAGPSTNADLSSLDVFGATLSPAFAPGTTAYSANVAYSVDVISLTPVVADSNSTVKVDGTDVQWGDPVPWPLAVGVNLTNVQVTAQNGSTKTYVVRVTRAGPSTDATLASLSLSQPGLMPMFNSWLTGYWLWVTNDVTTVIANARPTHPAATLALTLNDVTVSFGTQLPLVVGHNVLRFRVVAQDGITVKDYMVDVQRTAGAPPSPPPPPPPPPTTTTTAPTTTTPSPTTTTGVPSGTTSPTTTAVASSAPSSTTTTATTTTGSNEGASVEVVPAEQSADGSPNGDLPPAESEYAKSREVVLEITPPDGASQVVISNTADFKN